jgi:hypothetical protein
MHPILTDPEIAHQKRIPVVMVDPQGRLGVVGEPTLPQIGGRPRVSACAGEHHEQPDGCRKNRSHRGAL